MNWDVSFQIVEKFALALLLGRLLGLEREIAGKPAGLRTHMLLASSSALILALSQDMVGYFGDTSSELMRYDPIRILQAVVTGVSFLGAGTIFRDRGERIEGLTTAASLLFVSVLGITVGLGQVALAIVLTFLALVVLRGIRFVEKKMESRRDRSSP